MGVIHQWGDDGSGDGAAVSYDPVVISGAPDHDPSSVYDSLVDNGGGSYTIGVNNAVAVDGAGEGAIWVAPMPAGWVDDGTKLVVLKLTVEASAPDNVDLWVGLGVCDLTGDATNTGSDPLVAGVVRTTTADQLMTQNRLAYTVVGSSNGTVTYSGVWVPGGVLASLADIGTISARSVETGVEASRSGGPAADGNIRVIVTAGCKDAGATGPHTIRVLLEMAAIDMPT